MRPSGQPLPAEPELKRSVTLLEATIYGIGVIFGAGIYALIGETAGIAGNAMWLSFILAALIAAFTALSYAELSSIFPKSAAEYIYTKNAFRSKPFAFLIGWIMLLTGITAVSTVALGFGGYFAALSGLPLLPVALFMIAALSFLNFWGIKESARANIIFTLIESAGLVLIILIALPYFGSVDYFALPAGAASAVPDIFTFLSPVALAAGLIFFAYLGFEDMVNISEEINDARKNVPRALLLALAISTVVYILVAISVVSVVPYEELASSPAPLSLVAEKALGSSAGFLLAIIALFATANTVLVMLIAASRRLYGMAKESSLPKALARVHKTRRTPHIAVLATFILSCVFAIIAYIIQTASTSAIETIALMTNMGLFIMFASVNLSVIALRRSVPDNERGFKIPINFRNVPITAVLGILICLAFLTQFSAPVNILGIE
ncbi:APC family permease, partial [Candidatus Micrarchaeota archaeon]|nr:APC family permease [Candidatus Micrarchaeota archaeon]